MLYFTNRGNQTNKTNKSKVIIDDWNNEEDKDLNTILEQIIYYLFHISMKFHWIFRMRFIKSLISLA